MPRVRRAEPSSRQDIHIPMKKIMLKNFIVTAKGGLLLATVGTTAAANANTAPIPSPVGGTISLTVPDIYYSANGDCFDAPLSVKVDVPDDYAYADFDYSSTYNGPTEFADQIDGNELWSGTYSHTFLICPSLDHPGL